MLHLRKICSIYQSCREWAEQKASLSALLQPQELVSWLFWESNSQGRNKTVSRVGNLVGGDRKKENCLLRSPVSSFPLCLLCRVLRSEPGWRISSFVHGGWLQGKKSLNAFFCYHWHGGKNLLELGKLDQSRQSTIYKIYVPEVCSLLACCSLAFLILYALLCLFLAFLLSFSP